MTGPKAEIVQYIHQPTLTENQDTDQKTGKDPNKIV